MTAASKRTALLASGIVVIIVGLLVGLGLWVSAGQRESDAVSNLARAPIGCDTTLDFDAAGEFYIYIESAGRFDDAVDGDCGATGEYELSDDSLPPISLDLTASNGDDVALDSRAGIAYDSAGFVGTSVRSFTIDEPGSYQLRVESPGSAVERFAAAVGRNPSDGVSSMRLGAGLAALAGIVIGGVLIVLARRQQEPPPATPETPWPGQAVGWPTSPPGMPTAPPTPATTAPLGPPTYTPSPPGASPPPPPPGANWAPHGAPPDGQTAQPETPTWGGVNPDGSSGDGQRSPWAPPSDSAQ